MRGLRVIGGLWHPGALPRVLLATALATIVVAGIAGPASAARFAEHRRSHPALRASIASVGIAAAPQQQFSPGGVAMATARRIADAYWGFDPCGGQVQIEWASLDRSLNAASTWWNPTDAYGNPSQNDQCDVKFNTAQAWDWQMFCTVFVHEFGHLTGHPHVTDPAAVMYPVYVAPLAQCAQTPDPTAAVATHPAPVASATQASSRAKAARRRLARHARKHKRHHRRHHRARKHRAVRHA